MSVSDEEVEAALRGFGHSTTAALSYQDSVSPGDLRTDMRGALEAFMDFIATEGLP